MPHYTPRERIVAIVALSVALLGQISAVVVAILATPVFEQLFAGLGGPLPVVTRLFFTTRPFWWLVPLAFAALSFDALRRHEHHIGFVLASSTTVAFSMYSWLVAAMYAPMYDILRKIG